MRNVQGILTYLGIIENIPNLDGIVSKAKKIERVYSDDIDRGIVGYCLAPDFDNHSGALIDRGHTLNEINRYQEGLVVYQIN